MIIPEIRKYQTIKFSLSPPCDVHFQFIRFEALEYAGIYKDARISGENRALLVQTRDYVLRTVDGIRHDVRTQLNPTKIQKRIKSSMDKDKAGTVGFGTGAFLGFAL